MELYNNYLYDYLKHIKRYKLENLHFICPWRESVIYEKLKDVLRFIKTHFQNKLVIIDEEKGL